jgi:hypothetical protein
MHEFQRLEPDVEGEVRDVVSELALNGVPNCLEVLGHGLLTALRAVV